MFFKILIDILNGHMVVNTVSVFPFTFQIKNILKNIFLNLNISDKYYFLINIFAFFYNIFGIFVLVNFINVINRYRCKLLEFINNFKTKNYHLSFFISLINVVFGPIYYSGSLTQRIISSIIGCYSCVGWEVLSSYISIFVFLYSLFTYFLFIQKYVSPNRAVKTMILLFNKYIYRFFSLIVLFFMCFSLFVSYFNLNSGVLSIYGSNTIHGETANWFFLTIPFFSYINSVKVIDFNSRNKVKPKSHIDFFDFNNLNLECFIPIISLFCQCHIDFSKNVEFGFLNFLLNINSSIFIFMIIGFQMVYPFLFNQNLTYYVNDLNVNGQYYLAQKDINKNIIDIYHSNYLEFLRINRQNKLNFFNLYIKKYIYFVTKNLFYLSFLGFLPFKTFICNIYSMLKNFSYIPIYLLYFIYNYKEFLKLDIFNKIYCGISIFYLFSAYFQILIGC